LTYTQWVVYQRQIAASGGVTAAEAKAEADRLTALWNAGMRS
jgi:hypothetical protein